MSITIPTGGNGDLDWRNDIDNWRDADATWLQERSVVRVTTTPPTVGSATGNVANVTAGRVFYDITAGKLTLSLGSSYKNILASANLNPALDSSTDVVLKVDGASYGITLKSGTTPIVLDRINTLKVDTTGSNLAELTTSTSVDTATTVEVNNPIKVTSGTSPTTILRGTAVNTTTVTASGVVTGSRLVSTVGTGTAPLTVTSTTKVANLNADRVDDLDSADLLDLGNATGTLDLIKTSGTLATARGGTGISTSPVAGGIAYGATTSTYGVTAAGVTGQVVTSTGAAAPTWQYPDLYTCTSSTRPSSPAIGQVIYETNTGNVLVYYGATTDWKLPWNMPWGIVSRVSVATTPNPSMNTYSAGNWTDLSGFSLTNQFYTNRYYRVSFSVGLKQYLGTAVTTQFRVANGAASTVYATFPSVIVAATDSRPYSVANTFVQGTVSSVVKVQYQHSGSNSVAVTTADCLCEMTIEDLGPLSLGNAPTA